MNIKLTCGVCGGEVLYDKPDDRIKSLDQQDKAHLQLHKPDCEVPKVVDRISYFAEHGWPIQSEAVE